ncbi:sialate O-acetylesterase [Flavobacterium sp.]|uniref:sialate O-acetylesterase n=1 Tax=Flavobacterium sp. TaxID=239 RepID=UPI00261C2890|nr:sialate O-acetylesterase [Flavobacterium sp.]
MKNNLVLFIVVLCSNWTSANVTLPSFFSDHMVLQRNAQVKLWGWGNPKEEITITTSWDAKTYKVTTTNLAQWSTNVSTPKEGGPYVISFKGYNEVVLKNILIGEVWLCSGQSNMEMTANWGILNGDEEVAKATHPNIRFFTVAKASSGSPQLNLTGSWLDCTPETMKNSSAVAYFFAKQLRESLSNVPIGVIVSAWGGTAAEVWIPEAVIAKDDILKTAASNLKPNEYCPHLSGSTFNAMIQPLVGYTIAGTIWYQGESNVGATAYDKTFAALIESWRQLWNTNFPFYFVQIAPYNDGYNHFGSVQIRDFQRRTLQLPNTGMVVTSDISTTDDIHPKDKKSVGIRLANLALTKYYKTNNTLVDGPLYKNYSLQNDKIILSFDYANGLYFKNKTTAQFEIAAADNVFYTADAIIKNSTIVVSSKKVKKPIKVRFAWKNDAQSDLFNEAHLPASSFITE